MAYPGGRLKTAYTVPEGIEVIGAEAFHNNDVIVRVTLPESLLVIEEDAFSFCGSLASVNLPGCLCLIGYDAFNWCSSLSELTIPKSVTQIDGSDTFYAGNYMQVPLKVYSGSYAEQYCIENDLSYTVTHH